MLDGLASLGILTLQDNNADFFNSGLPVYYRTRNFDVNRVGVAVNEFGFTWNPINTSGALTPGTTDVKIYPQPSVKLLTQKQISVAQKANVALRTNGRMLNISHSWVQSIQLANNFSDPRQVFIDKSVVGFVTDNLLLEIVSYIHNDVYGEIMNWDVICNGSELTTNS